MNTAAITGICVKNPAQIVGSLRGPRAVKLVITDVDGTLASFWDYFAPAMREYISYLNEKIGDDAFDLTKQIGAIMHARGTHEHPWVLEETPFAREHFAHKPDFFYQEFVVPFWQMLDSERHKYLRPFPGVLQTLAAIKELGIKVVALSDAPEHMAMARNRQLFNGLMDAVYALENTEPSESEIFHPNAIEFGRARISQLRLEAVDAVTPLRSLPKSFEKPNPGGVDQILADFDVAAEDVLLIGDNLLKDGLAASARSIRYIWAHYGVHLPAEYDQLVNGLLRPSTPDAVIDIAPPEPVAIAARFEEVGRHLLIS